MRQIFSTAFGIILALFLLLFGCVYLVSPHHSHESNEEAHNWNALVQAMPDNERKFVAALNTGLREYDAGENEMQKGVARVTRAKEICNVLSGNFRVYDWVGIISMLESNSAGKGVLGIQITNSAWIKTHNNFLSDSIDLPTLIEPDTELGKTVARMHVGDKVKFSGTFHKGLDDCIQEASLSLRGSMVQSEFFMSFQMVSPIVAESRRDDEPKIVIAPVPFVNETTTNDTNKPVEPEKEELPEIVVTPAKVTPEQQPHYNTEPPTTPASTVLVEHSEEQTNAWFDACKADGARAAEAALLAQGKVDQYCTFLAAFYKVGVDPDLVHGIMAKVFQQVSASNPVEAQPAAPQNPAVTNLNEPALNEPPPAPIPSYALPIPPPFALPPPPPRGVAPEYTHDPRLKRCTVQRPCYRNANGTISQP